MREESCPAARAQRTYSIDTFYRTHDLMYELKLLAAIRNTFTRSAMPTWKHRGRVFAAAPASIRTFFVQVMLAACEIRTAPRGGPGDETQHFECRRVYRLVRSRSDVRVGRTLSIFSSLFILIIDSPSFRRFKLSRGYS